MFCHPLTCAYMVDGHEMVTTNEREAIRQGCEEAFDSYDIKELISLVIALANMSAPYDHEYGDCILCEKLGRSDPVEPEDHDPACPWRRARAWVDTHVAAVARNFEA